MKRRGSTKKMAVKDLHFPDYAKDIKLNLGRLVSDEEVEGLTLQQSYGIALASSYATKNQKIIHAIISQTTNTLSESDITAAKAAATIMAMNNIYYRSIHLIDDKEYSKMPAQLRMNIIRNSGIDRIHFELMSLAVSAINGCGLCLNAHIHEIIKNGISKQGIQSCLRIAAVINGAAQSLEINH